jgi:mRNA interferase YafQ
MLEPIRTGQFKKDYKLAGKRHYDMNELKAIITLLVNEQPLPAHCHEHGLHGVYEGKLECHVQPDWLLVYEIDTENSAIIFHRTGTHSDLF